MKKQSCQLISLPELHIFAKKILSSLNSARCLTLSGELGSGKTTFVQQLGKLLKIKNKITSPTFVLLKVYSLPKNNYQLRSLCHVDLYRAQKGSFLFLQEYLNNPEVLTIIEWPDKIKKLPTPRIDIKFQIISHHTRRVSVNLKSGKKKLGSPLLAV